MFDNGFEPPRSPRRTASDPQPSSEEALARAAQLQLQSGVVNANPESAIPAASPIQTRTLAVKDGGAKPKHTGKKRAVPKSTGREIAEWVGLIVGSLFVAFLIKAYLIQAFYIPSRSMEDTLLIDDHVIVNKLAYKLGSVQRGDIIVFAKPETDNSQANASIKDLIKRVVALPGERIRCDNNRIVIDDVPLDEPYIKGRPCTDLAERTIPQGTVWVMGDNRENSSDSRVFGPVSQDIIVGRAFVRVWPLGRFGSL
jgi:signal peptidase I